ncbi:exosortase/archaeosortase family protein [Ruficoccus sp. ZRK36]|uniref:exosortase/archaeosortase family protein n=1 Tax=Ruficoccus sp. ZRK36 TaxID=2866311 RepID=UPI001C73DE46|nr:exosortase/archaeosortase family protein [Ruficoccus sp. ZRK36]QYY36461.1 exosortase/archaeosortase family protein [Ruficoccus sp. ZRK36]
MPPQVSSPSSSRVLWTQRLIIGAIVAVCAAPFLAHTSPDEKSRMMIKAMAIAAALACITLNRTRFTLRASPLQSICGLLLILTGCALTLADTLGGLRDPGAGFILGAAGVSIIATGWCFNSLKIRCMGLFALAAIPAGAAENLIESGLRYSTVVAKLAAFVLHYVGFTVRSEGNIIYTQGHAVEIIAECSGLKLFFMLAAFCAILLLCLPQLRTITGRMLLAAFGTGLIVSILRIDFLVLIVGQPALFEFFHHGIGSELISLAAILIFFAFIKEQAFTALESYFPIPEIPSSSLPTPSDQKLLNASLIAAIVIGLGTAAVVELAA